MTTVEVREDYKLRRCLYSGDSKSFSLERLMKLKDKIAIYLDRKRLDGEADEHVDNFSGSVVYRFAGVGAEIRYLNLGSGKCAVVLGFKENSENRVRDALYSIVMLEIGD